MDTIANTHVEVLINTAITLLTRGEPLPLDIVTKLLAEGIDVASLENKYFL